MEQDTGRLLERTATRIEYCKVDADGTRSQGTHELVREHRLDVLVDGKAVLRLTCTKDALRELVVGRLLTEGLIRGIDEIDLIHFCDEEYRANVFLKKGVTLSESTRVEPTCCTGNQVYLERAAVPLKQLPEGRWRPEWIFSLAEAFSKDRAIHQRTGGTHSCFLCVDGEIVFAGEDIGRHNALDKCVGYALLNGLDRSHCILFTTGRVPTDMVEKVIAAGIPVLVSKAVPTDQAVILAREYGLTLICRAWPDSYEIYHS